MSSLIKFPIGFCRENKEKNNSLTFQLPPFLASEQSELDLLRKLADIMMVNLLPRSYIDCLPLRHFFRELLACQGKSVCEKPPVTCLTNILFGYVF
jgi:PXA domain